MPISSVSTISVFRKFLLGYVSQFHTDSDEEAKIGNCSVIYDDDKDFGEVEVVDTSPTEPQLLPSQKIDPEKLKHLSAQQQKELLSVLDEYPCLLYTSDAADE